MWWTLELTLHAFYNQNSQHNFTFFFFTSTPMLNDAVCFLFSFYHLPSSPISCFVSFLFLFSCHRSTLLGLRYRWDTATSITGQGHYCCCTSPSRLCLFYDSSVMPHLPLPLLLPISGFLSALSLPSHMYFYQSSSVSSTCHRHRAVCLYPCMCIPYSISRCSLTLYGALASHHRLCQSSFIRFCCVII